MFPEKLIDSISNKHAEIFVHYTAECEDQLNFRTKAKEKPLFVATIYHLTQQKNLKRTVKPEKDGYGFSKIDKVTIVTCNTIKKLNPIFYKK